MPFERVSRRGDTFMLDGGVLLLVATDYLHDLNAFATQIAVPPQNFPNTRPGENEGDYNERLSTRSTYASDATTCAVWVLGIPLRLSAHNERHCRLPPDPDEDEARIQPSVQPRLH